MAKFQTILVMALMVMWSVLSLATAMKYYNVLNKHSAHHSMSRSHSYPTQCPTWHTENESVCRCGNSVQGLVKCNEYDDTVELLACYCMSRSKVFNKTIIGNCIYLCNSEYWNTLPNQTSKLDSQMCGPFKRTGQLCGNCIPNYAPPIYSYHLECVRCINHTTNWFKYLAVAFLPLTIFYLVIIMFRISAVTPKLRCYILISQIAAMPGHLRYLTILQRNHIENHKFESRLSDIGLSLFSIWNLDFFRAVYHPFCIHPRIGSLGVLALDYLTAMYPLYLIFVTYCCIKVYDHFPSRQIFVRFQQCCFRFRKEWNIQRSLMDVFATFLLLSYVKILNISFDLLLPTKVYDMNGDKYVSFLYYSGTVQMFKGEHIPFAILALFMLIVFNIIPLMVLCCYPCRCFQKLMNSCKCHSQMLHVFMDIFHGCYRTKPVDCRYFSALYLFLRMINLIVYSSTLNRYYYPFAAILSLVAAVLVATFQPYKISIYNKLDTCLFLLFTSAYIPATALALSPIDKFDTTFSVMIVMPIIVLLSYIVSLIAYWIIPLQVKEQMAKTIKRFCVRMQPIRMEEDFLGHIQTFQPTA